MKARMPQLDFSESLPAWAPNREFAHMFNAFSVIIMQLEPYLNKTAARVRGQLPHGDPLRDDLTIFIRQEATHTLIHRQYNEALYRAGYIGLKTIEQDMADEYQRFLDTKPLLWNIGYAQGFEIVGPIYAEFIFEKIDDLLEGADQKVADMWRWHLAEEYEHRMVAHEAYHRVGGNYFHRLWVTWKTLQHLGRFNARAEKLMLDIDAQAMTPQERKASRIRTRKVHRRLSLFLLRKVLPVLMPWYTPARWRAPDGAQHFLDMTAAAE
ncbi:hypothetical protein NT2_09_00820 [Caenibius tardaugens NBRC 16725]|uniref:Metal-dependent hydrolase n=2 Tax=Caenibius TaxID=2827482 RepID=U2ZYL4_9SPHN|nr:hypothetical protein EGO55_05215 [Caenibius tardaugens NBRC 16725]GAD50474.1 hypothetical protein NT2_09_00820 [Caenibius tardaugens NBRC 16725]